MSDFEYYFTRAGTVVIVLGILTLLSHLTSRKLRHPEMLAHANATTFALGQATIVMTILSVISGIISLTIF